ncbi:hypothetical protein ABL78_1412 [Leptomonas seymouri]|uniref:Uncharacterized protein n=1 Tax=Leptomonas seymouri TaxID=5684 RepID=A0A0N1PEV9_LEPSE|nr:hypothetical protein ABL78_1412 [Leptomonas seymouri]|eukprot:KPI89448.1 hypothetical protein ABL78_1412 [Leptomonas seymouri]
MYSPTFGRDATQAWGAASSPSPAAAVDRFRSPRDDAPVYDPLLWKGTDNSYISTLASHVMTHQPLPAPGFGSAGQGKPAASSLDKFLTSSWAQSPEEEAAERLSRFHADYNFKPTTLVGRVMQFISSTIFPWWHEGVKPTDVGALSTNELIHLMQLALAAGEVERSAMLARELSRRKLALQMQALPTNLGSLAGFEVQGNRPVAPPPPASPTPQPVGAADYGGFVPRREQQQPWSRLSESLGVSPGRAALWTQQRSDYSALLNRDYANASRSISVNRTAPGDGDAPHRQQMPSVSAATSQCMSDVSVSSLRGSEGDSTWLSGSRWSGRWAPPSFSGPY